MSASRPTLAAALCALLASSMAARAGTISLAWDPVDHPALAGYRVYYDTVAGAFAQSLDAGPTTAATLSGLADCTSYEVAVKAYDDDGNESDTFSPPVTGWARPILTSVLPASIERHSQATLTLDGSNFMQGAILAFDDAAVTVLGVGWASCHRLVIEVNVGAAALGPLEMQVINPDGVFGTGAGLLSIGTDATAPGVTAVAVTTVTATTATIGWSTSEPANGRLLFRREDQTAWQTSTLQAGFTTSHSVTIEGLWPQTSYEFRVESADAAGNTASSAPGGFDTLASSHTFLRFEAEAGHIDGPIVDGAAAASFANAWIEVAGGTPTGVLTDPAGTATYGFWTPSSGTWYVWVRMYGISQQNDSWFERVDNASFAPIQPPGINEWQWVEARSYVLNAGQHVLTLGGREALTRLDRVLVTSDAAFVPTEQPGDDVTPPSAVTGLAALPANAQVALAWTQPADPDAARLVARYRTDGVAPTSPIDGMALLDTVALPAGPASHVHSGLSNGTTYTYSLFVVDAAGNASAAGTVQATPATQPPPAVGNVHRTDTL